MVAKTHNAITLNADNFEQAVLQSEQPVLVDFWAEWCPPCRAIGPVIEEIASEFDGVATIGKVDVDKNASLAERYAIGSIPTMLLFNDGVVVDRIQGVVPKGKLTTRLAALLETASVEHA